MNELEPIPLVLPGMMLPTADELKASNVGKIEMLQVGDMKLGEFSCFNRNLKPRVRIKHYPSGLTFWVVERDTSIPWRKLTMQEKENIHAAYEWLETKGRQIKIDILQPKE